MPHYTFDSSSSQFHAPPPFGSPHCSLVATHPWLSVLALTERGGRKAAALARAASCGSDLQESTLRAGGGHAPPLTRERSYVQTSSLTKAGSGWLGFKSGRKGVESMHLKAEALPVNSRPVSSRRAARMAHVELTRFIACPSWQGHSVLRPRQDKSRRWRITLSSRP